VELAEFDTLLDEVVDNLLGSLERIEADAQMEETPQHHELARIYAGLVSTIRGYQAGARAGRPMPRQLADQIETAAGGLSRHGALVQRLKLHPDGEEFSGLIALARGPLT
jgi:hypothetical protein